MVCAHMKKNVQKISIAMCIQPLILAPAKSPHPLSQGNDAIQNNNFFWPTTTTAIPRNHNRNQTYPRLLFYFCKYKMTDFKYNNKLS